MMLLEYHGARILFTGDLNAVDERRLLRHFRENVQDLFPADVLKITHHGSEHGSSCKFIAAVKPAFAIVSDKPGDPDHELSAEAAKRVLDTPVGKREIYQTGSGGDVVVETDGAAYKDGILYRVTIDRNGRLHAKLNSE